MINKISTLAINPIIKDKEPSIYIHKIKAFLDSKNQELSNDASSMKKIAHELETNIQENRKKLSELESIHVILTDDLNEKIKRQVDVVDITDSLETVNTDIKGLKDLLRSQETTLSNTQKEWNTKKLKLISELDKIWESITVYIDVAKKDIESITDKLQREHTEEDGTDNKDDASVEEDLYSSDSDIESIDSDYDEDDLKLISQDSDDSTDSPCPDCKNLLCTCVD
jgi:small-conductance mechanosensitive channel